jgi:hypothetical protein
MSLWDDLNRFAGHLIHGDLGGALDDAGQAAQDAAQAAENAVQAAEARANQLLQGATGGAQGRGAGFSVPSVSSPASGQKGVAGAAADHSCCKRFSFNGGFLVDGATGRVWQFSATANTFTEVPVVNTPARQGLADSLVESKLASFRSQYEQQVLATIAPAQRAAALTQFEKDHLDPLRAAAKTVTY